MFTQVRMFIKTGVGFLVIGLVLGTYLTIERELLDAEPNRYLISAHAHVVGVGFVMFMILGVALWLFPRPEKDDPLYRPSLVVWVYWLMTVGTAGRFVAETLRGVVDGPRLGWIVLAGGAAQAIAIVLYFVTIWSRIRPVGSHLRELKGERF